MAEPLKISGELTHDPSMCHFHLNRPLVDGWTLSFDSAEAGKGSPLIDALFAGEVVHADDGLLDRDSSLVVLRRLHREGVVERVDP